MPSRPPSTITPSQSHTALGPIAAELAYLEFGGLIDTLVDDGKFTSAESRTLARRGLANYFAAATVLPYKQFHSVAESFRYDIVHSIVGVYSADDSGEIYTQAQLIPEPDNPMDPTQVAGNGGTGRSGSGGSEGAGGPG